MGDLCRMSCWLGSHYARLSAGGGVECHHLADTQLLKEFILDSWNIVGGDSRPRAKDVAPWRDLVCHSVALSMIAARMREVIAYRIAVNICTGARGYNLIMGGLRCNSNPPPRFAFVPSPSMVALDDRWEPWSSTGELPTRVDNCWVQPRRLIYWERGRHSVSVTSRARPRSLFSRSSRLWGGEIV
jgi:hypothetical protein